MISFANRVKVLVHDGIGIWLAARRLHQGKFIWPKDGDATLALTRTQFDALVLDLAKPTKMELEAAMAGHVLAETKLTATYPEGEGRLRCAASIRMASHGSRAWSRVF